MGDAAACGRDAPARSRRRVLRPECSGCSSGRRTVSVPEAGSLSDGSDVSAERPRLSVVGLGVAFGGSDVVAGVSYAVAPGQICAIVGASGSGKSVHASAILGTVAPAARVSGAVFVDGTDLAQVPVAHRRRRVVAHVGQDPSTTFNPLRPVRDQVRDVLRARGLTGAAVDSEWNALVERLGLASVPGLGTRAPGELSGGQLQRLAFAYACACDAAVTVLDEPTTALDAVTQRDLVRLLPALTARGGAGVFITHDVALAAEVADRILVFEGGTLVDSLTPRALRGDAELQVGGSDSTTDLVAAARRREAAMARMVAGAKPGRALDDGALDAGALPAAAAGVSGASGASILQLAGVTVRSSSGQPILVDVDVDVRAGQRMGVLGSSGAGKSTLLRVLMGAIAPAEGQLLLRGEPADTSRRGRRLLARTVQYVPQHARASLPPGRCVEDIILQPARDLLGRGEATSWYARELVDHVGLAPEVLPMTSDELSGGQAQRVCLARALAPRPAVLLADEPTSSLDLVLRERTLSLLRTVSGEVGVALVFVTHDTAAVAELCDELLVLERGRVVERGLTASRLSAPDSEALRSLVGGALRLPTGFMD
ncbi:MULTISPECIES: ATP-binding cassette domain-containing protein [unclassified Pseudoclavibacter]|uniref:ABC transporter ATP-binding protein n=1 Tax=unclassified Pseudoclavibacter TaxID=2615177 RepID=UPI00280070D0|nr:MULTISPECIES: ATP-binding cassette domain-containing protein [unclassified Pseudoclavibacter]